MEKNFYCEKYLITDLLLSTDLTKTQIAEQLEITIPELNKRIKSYGLDWVKAKKRKMSRGQTAIVDILKKILPNEKIDFEHHIGERLLLDIYVPSYDLAIEYHGRQHFEFSAFFHKSEIDFELSQERDERKIELCKELGITLVIFRYNDVLNEDTVFERILHSIKTQPAKRHPQCRHPVDQEYEKVKKDLVQAAKKNRSKARKEWKARRENDEEFRRNREAFKKQVKANRKQLRDAYLENRNPRF